VSWRLLAALTLIPRVAAADGFDLVGVGARATARAGACTVSADDGAALFYDPAGLARRTSLRAQAGLSFAETSSRWTSGAPFAAGGAAVEDRAAPAVLPWGGIQLGLGERITIGVAFLAPAAYDVDDATPTSYAYTVDDRAAYPGRYAGSSLHLRRQAGAIGVGVRALPWLAIGAAALVAHVSMDETRTLWAGATQLTGLTDLDPRFDMRLSASGSAWTAGGTFGALVAPLDAPIELAAAIALESPASLPGAADLLDSREQMMGVPDVKAMLSDPRASIRLPGAVTARAGARLVEDRFVVEADGEVEHGGAATPAWALTGVALAPTGRPGATRIDSLPAALALEDRYTLRAAADVDVIPGALTVTLGYAFSRRPTARTSSSPLFPGADGHTIAGGLEGRVAGALVTIGVARTFDETVDLSPSESGVAVLTPLAAGAIPAAGGHLSGGATLVSAGVEIELP
jgi:hypothetical protein